MRTHIFCLALGLLVSSQVAAIGQMSWQVNNRVVVEHGVLLIDHTKSVKEISAAQAKGGFKADLGVGLFESRIKAELVMGEMNAAWRRINLTTRVTTAPVIYVARELPKDSCAYKLVLAHELKHQDYDLEVLRLLPNEIRQFSQDVFAGDELEGGGDPARWQNRFRSRFFQQFNYVYQGLGELRHPIIDSPEAYRQLSSQCNGELGRLLAGSGGKNSARATPRVAK